MPVHNLSHDRQRTIGHDRSVIVLDPVHQPDEVTAFDILDCSVAELGIDETL